MDQPLPVICDRCRATGTAGSGEFSHLGDLLEFEPVAVQPRVNGWDPDAQRAFIALLSVTGSKHRAATAIGRNAFGIGRLLERPDSASFKAAFDRAKAIAKAQGSMRLASGVADAAARNAFVGNARGRQASYGQLVPPSRLRGMAPEPFDDEAEGMSDDLKFEMLENLFRKHLLKVRAEREARLGGEIVAADFYLRQITFFEIALDLMAEGAGLDGWQMLASLRRGGDGVLAIAATPISRALDTQRRALWAANGEAAWGASKDGSGRPEHPPQAWLEDCDTHAVEPLPTPGDSDPPPGIDPDAWSAMSIDEQKEALAEIYRQAAEEQVAWESSAQLAWEAKAQSGRGPEED